MTSKFTYIILSALTALFFCADAIQAQNSKTFTVQAYNLNGTLITTGPGDAITLVAEDGDAQPITFATGGSGTSYINPSGGLFTFTLVLPPSGSKVVNLFFQRSLALKGNTDMASTTVTSISSTAALTAGMTVTSPTANLIPPNTKIVEVLGASKIVLNNMPGATMNNATLVFAEAGANRNVPNLVLTGGNRNQTFNITIGGSGTPQ